MAFEWNDRPEGPAALAVGRATGVAYSEGAAHLNPRDVYLASLPSENSQRAMDGALRLIARRLGRDADNVPWQHLRREHVAALRANLAKTYSRATVNQALSALRGVLKSCFDLHLIDGDTYHRTVDVKSLSGTDLPAGRVLDRGEIQALFDAMAKQGGIIAVRDAALLAALYGCGLRRAEAVSLRVEDYDAEQALLRIRHAKGRQQRITPCNAGVNAALEDWMAVRGTGDGPSIAAHHGFGSHAAHRDHWRRGVCPSPALGCPRGRRPLHSSRSPQDDGQ